MGVGLCAIHPSSWNGHSRKLDFHFTELSEVRIQGILGSSLAHEGVRSRPHPSPRHKSSAYDKARRRSAKAATLEPTSVRAATKASGPTSEGPPEVGSGLSVAGALGLARWLSPWGGIGRRLANARNLEAPGFLPLEAGGVDRLHLDCVLTVGEPTALVA